VLLISLQTFQKYLSYKKDHSELLYYILRQITLDTLAFQKALHGGRITTVEISEKDLLDRVMQIILLYYYNYIIILNLIRSRIKITKGKEGERI